MLLQNLGNAIHGPQIRAQSVMQALIINARLSFSIGQRCLALDHALGESASQSGCAIDGIVNKHALSPHGEDNTVSLTVITIITWLVQGNQWQFDDNTA